MALPEPEKIDEMVANVAGAGFNAIFFQVRGIGDAYYTPGLEPWAARLSSGTVTESLGVDPGWDPLARLLDVAHTAGVEVHAYVNVYPAWMPVYTSTYSSLAPPATIPPQMFDRFTYGPSHPDHPGEYGLGGIGGSTMTPAIRCCWRGIRICGPARGSIKCRTTSWRWCATS